jgi:UDP-glucose 4-epimerase
VLAAVELQRQNLTKSSPEVQFLIRLRHAGTHMRSSELTVLVTGGAGFIGSHVVDKLRDAGHRPVIFDVRPPTEPAHRDVRSVVGDLDDLERLCAAMRGCDAVIHLAAAADVNEVKDAPVDAERRNSRGTVHVLEAARRCALSRVVYASTIWVYSDTPAECHEETMALQPPAHIYSATKLAGELYCHSYRELYGVEHTILRFGIPYGPRARPAAVVPAFVNRALAGEALTIAGDGLQTRRFVYVEDLAEGVVRGLDPVAANRTYNLVSEVDTTIKEIAEAVRDILGDVTIEHVPGRSGDFAGAPVSGARAAEELGWRPATPFAEGVRRYVEWHRAAPAAVAAAVAAPERATSRSLAPLARRGALTLLWAAVTAVTILGVIGLAPLDEDTSTYGWFAGTLIVLVPLVLTGAFEWEEPWARRLGTVLWTAAIVALFAALSPWPSPVDRLADHHAIVLALFAVTAATAARLPARSAPLRQWLASAGS